MFDKLSNNLNILMANARMNASELARKTGVPASTIKKIRNADNPNPTLTTLIPIARNFSLTVSELIGDIEITVPQNAQADNRYPEQACLRLLSWHDAPNWQSATSAASSIINQFSNNSFALTIEEDNWEGFAKDSIIIIDPDKKPEHRNFVLAHRAGNDLPAIRQFLLDDGNTYLKPVITGYQINLLTPDVRVIGTIVEIRKNLLNKTLNESK